MTTLVAVAAGSEQVPPVLERVIVTTPLLVLAVPAQWFDVVPTVTVGVPGTVNAELNVTKILSLVARAVVGVNPTVQFEGAAPAVGEPGV
jgi:hypothetical protein